MEQKKFDLPKHPTKGEQYLLVERPSSESVWYLVVEPDKSVPLVNLKNPESAKDVMDAVGSQYDQDWIMQFVAGGYSRRGDL